MGRAFVINMPIEDFIFEVREEILSYEQMGEKKAQQWENNFKKWLNNDKIKKKNIKLKGNNRFYILKDESEIFDIVDLYFNAVEQGREDEYWNNFQ